MPKVSGAVSGQAWRLAAVVVVAYVFGWVAGRTPAPSDASVFWIGNLAAVYLVLGVLAGAWVPRWGVLAGALASAAAVAGFYSFLTVGDVTNLDVDLPPTVTARAVVLHMYGDWLGAMVWGTRGVPWLTVGLVTGGVSGYLGSRARAGRDLWGVWLVGLALICEPLVYLAGLNVVISGMRYRVSDGGNLAVWGAEFAAGVAVLIGAAVARRRRTAFSPATGPASSPPPRSAV